MIKRSVSVLSCLASVILASSGITPSWAAKGNIRLSPETKYARLVGGAGYGFCEFTRMGRLINARVVVAGMDSNSIGTTWIFIDDVGAGRLDGTVASEGGDAAFFGSFSASRRAVIKLDVRDHQERIQYIGNNPNDEGADEDLVRELTTPAPFRMGTCTVSFSRNRN